MKSKRITDIAIAGVCGIAVVVAGHLLMDSLSSTKHPLPLTFTVKSSQPTIDAHVSVVAAEGNPKIESHITCDSEAASYSVLDKLNPILYLRSSPTPTLEQIDRNEKQIQCIREFARTIKDPCVYQQYVSWLDLYHDSDEQIKTKIEEHKEDELDTYENRKRARDIAVAKFNTIHEVPIPPDSCEWRVVRKVK